MSIAARVVPFSRSIRTLIRKHAALAKPIKDLKDLRVLRVHACYRHSGPKGPEEHKRRFSLARAMARDRPSPYGEGAAFFYRSAGALGCHTRMRAGFPRDRWIVRACSMARDRPSPYVKGRRFFHRSARACPSRSLDCADDVGTRRSLPPGKRHRSGCHETILTTTSYETPAHE